MGIINERDRLVVRMAAHMNLEGHEFLELLAYYLSVQGQKQESALIRLIGQVKKQDGLDPFYHHIMMMYGRMIAPYDRWDTQVMNPAEAEKGAADVLVPVDLNQVLS